MPTLNDFFSGIRWLIVENTSGVNVPAYAVMRETGLALTGEIQIGQPTADGQPGCLLGGPTDIPGPAAGVTATGMGTADVPWFALYEVADGSPAVGETWGPGAGSWKLRKGKAGYLIYGGADGQKVLVTAAAGAGRPAFSGCKAAVAAPSLTAGSGSINLIGSILDTDGYIPGGSNVIVFPFVGVYLVGFDIQFSWSGFSGFATFKILTFAGGDAYPFVGQGALLSSGTGPSPIWLSASGLIVCTAAGQTVGLGYGLVGPGGGHVFVDPTSPDNESLFWATYLGP